MNGVEKNDQPVYIMKKIISVSIIFTCVLSMVSGQDVKISGVVMDEQNKPIPGANIVQYGTPNGTATNYEGRFELELPEGDHKLFVAFIGYKSTEQEISIQRSNRYEVEIILVKNERKNKKLKSSGKVLVEPIINQ
jgi:TonB-dependent starch-binding outer membrane protein SusC